jgi:hypothetical protein
MIQDVGSMIYAHVDVKDDISCGSVVLDAAALAFGKGLVG